MIAFVQVYFQVKAQTRATKDARTKTKKEDEVILFELLVGDTEGPEKGEGDGEVPEGA